MIKHPKIEELSRAVNAKARELQGVQEAVDAAKLDIQQYVDRKGRLVKEINDLDQVIKEKKDHLASVIEKENAYLSNVVVEVKTEKEKLQSMKKECAEANKEFMGLLNVIKECQDYLKKAGKAREEYLLEKGKFDEISTSLKKLISDAEQAKTYFETEKREMGEYKNYLTDFYGKVATYAITAQEIVEVVNLALEEHIPLRFQPPSEPITMDNFNKYD